MRRTVIAGAAVALVGVAPAAAHVVLTRYEVPADEEVALAFRAPIERENTTNQRIYALVPGPFTVTGCVEPTVAWSCSLDTTTRPGDTFVTWETPVAGSPQDLRFEFTVRTPSSRQAGEYKFPVVQTYSDGHDARWIQDGEPSPAPRLRVVPEGQPVSTAEPTPPPDATRAPAPRPAPSSSPSARASASRAASMPAAATATATTTGTAVPTTAATADASPSGGVEVIYSEAVPVERSDGGSRPVGPVVAGIAAVMGAAAGLIVLVVRRRAA